MSLLRRRSLIARGVPALAACALVSCRQNVPPASGQSQPDSAAAKRSLRAAKVAMFNKTVDKTATATPYIYAEWPDDIKSGDCTIHKGARFLLYRDGHTHWECNASSTDTGDEWDMNVLLYDSGYKPNDPSAPYYPPMAMVGRFHFDIRDANTVKRWVQDYGPNAIFYPTAGVGLLEVFERSQWAALSCSC